MRTAAGLTGSYYCSQHDIQFWQHRYRHHHHRYHSISATNTAGLQGRVVGWVVGWCARVGWRVAGCRVTAGGAAADAEPPADGHRGTGGHHNDTRPAITMVNTAVVTTPPQSAFPQHGMRPPPLQCPGRTTAPPLAALNHRRSAVRRVGCNHVL